MRISYKKTELKIQIVFA